MMRVFLFLFLLLPALVHGTPSVNSRSCVIVKDDRSGNSVSCWMSVNEEGYGVIESKIIGTKGQIVLDQTLSNPSTSASIPILTMDVNSNVMAVWSASDFQSGKNGLYVSTLPLAGATGQRWSPAVVISLPDENVLGNYDAAIDKNGNISVIWLTSLHKCKVKSIQLATGIFNSTGGSWNKPIPLSE